MVISHTNTVELLWKVVIVSVVSSRSTITSSVFQAATNTFIGKTHRT